MHAHLGRQLLAQRQHHEVETRVVDRRVEGPVGEGARATRAGDRPDLQAPSAEADQVVGEVGELGDRLPRQRDCSADRQPHGRQPRESRARPLEGAGPPAHRVVRLGEPVEADRDAVELRQHRQQAPLCRQQAVAHHRHAVAELARPLHDLAQRPVDEGLAAREADRGVALGAEHAERLADDGRVERALLAGSRRRVAVQAGEIAEPRRVEVDDAVGQEARPLRRDAGYRRLSGGTHASAPYLPARRPRTRSARGTGPSR